MKFRTPPQVTTRMEAAVLVRPGRAVAHLVFDQNGAMV
jgi:hypothetical protein